MRSTRGAGTGAIGGWVLFAVLAAGSLTAGPGGCFLQPETLPPRPGDSGDACGDGGCAPNEDIETCPEDCAVCGDGICSAAEQVISPCPQDCDVCGDGACLLEEDINTCPQDCAVCGDGVCSAGEDPVSCALDCGSVDCTSEPDFASCSNCFAEQYPGGAAIYNALVDCVICVACYTVCQGMSGSQSCPMAPAMTDPCDGDMADPALCGDTFMGCIACGIGGSCADEVTSCQNDAECVEFATAIGNCPQ